jgi:hypothetical protein
MSALLLLGTNYLILWKLLCHAQQEQGKCPIQIAILNWGHYDLPMATILMFMNILNTTIRLSQMVIVILFLNIPVITNFLISIYRETIIKRGNRAGTGWQSSINFSYIGQHWMDILSEIGWLWHIGQISIREPVLSHTKYWASIANSLLLHRQTLWQLQIHIAGIENHQKKISCLQKRWTQSSHA